MQPQYDIQREVEVLRDLRRRSTGPGALLLDPDLPSASPNDSSSTAVYWGAQAPNPTSTDRTSSISNDAVAADNNHSSNLADDPLSLFWVPADLHPEIAPAEFRAFLKEHARSPAADGTTNLERSNSASSTSSLVRKRSMLSRQYRPLDSDNTDDEREEEVVPLRRNRSVYSNPLPQLTISDLQKLEELAASDNDGPAKLRNILRRSLSLNMSPSEIDNMEGDHDMGDEADSPIIVPPPNQILRRSARTKIRKNNLPGDGGGHRFGSSRRGRGSGGMTAPPENRLSDTSSTEHGEAVDLTKRRPYSEETPAFRPESFSEEAAIYEAYARDDEEEDGEQQTPTTATTTTPSTTAAASPTPEERPELSSPQSAPAIIQYQPQIQGPEASPLDLAPARYAPSIESSIYPMPLDYREIMSPMVQQTPTAPTPPQQRKEKGIFSMWGKKSNKEKDRDSRDRVEKEKETGFFGSLFSSKKKQDDGAQSPGHSMSGQERAQAMLGGFKSSKGYGPPSPPLLLATNGVYARYPIHVERAIYRLSHIKLANPRRALYEQVLISNLMFWYLGVINKAQNPATSPSEAGFGQTAAENEQIEQEKEEERLEVEREAERLEKERAEMDRLEKERIAADQRRESRRGSLTKTPGAGRRVAEMPVKGPQYDLQHKVMEQEYSGFGGQPVSASAPIGRSVPVPVPGQPRMQPSPTNSFSGPARNVLQPQSLPNDFYYGVDSLERTSVLEFLDQQQHQLPPGAMPPVNMESQPLWLSTSPTSPRTSPPSQPLKSSSINISSDYSNPRRSRSPPPPTPPLPPNNGPPMIPNRYAPPAEKTRLPGRSLSATASSSPHTNVNGRPRKGLSVSAATPTNGKPRTSDGLLTGEEEDVPLALWQQRRR